MSHPTGMPGDFAPGGAAAKDVMGFVTGPHEHPQHHGQPGPWRLPDRGQALRLVAADVENAARMLDVEPAAIRAVAEVESGGRTGFDGKRPKIRYENHYFRHWTQRRYDHSHPHLSAGYQSAQYYATHGSHSDQWALLREAFKLDPGAAVQSCSWGMFQVMGENYRSGGWSDLRQFASDMFLSEAQHLRAFLGFCRGKHLVPYLKRHQWAAFARGYNGEAYRDNAYDLKIASAYRRYSRQAHGSGSP